jgi:hypothetical protein
MKMEEGEIRWFVVKVPTFKSRGHKEDPDFRMKMKAEIPAWLHFLKNRKVFHPKEGRAWFNPDYIITSQMKEIVENTRNYLERMVDEYMQEQFLLFGLLEITMPLDFMVDAINKQAKHKLDKLQVKKYLEKKKQIKKEPLPGHIKIPIGFIDSTRPDKEILYHTNTYRYYIMKREDWLSETPLVAREEVAVSSAPEIKTDVSNKQLEIGLNNDLLTPIDEPAPF